MNSVLRSRLCSSPVEMANHHRQNHESIIADVPLPEEEPRSAQDDPVCGVVKE